MIKYYCHLAEGLSCFAERGGMCEAGRFEKCRWKKEFPKRTTPPPPPTTGSNAVPTKYKIKATFALNTNEEYKRGYFDGYVAGVNNLLKELLEEEKR